jgi:Dolichyl-phosphate-mannose-protein mannosyltransferase
VLVDRQAVDSSSSGRRSPDPPPPHRGREAESAHRGWSRYLFFLFLISLALLNPWVRGDGVGYYAFARAPLIAHNFDFLPDYTRANDSFREGRLDEFGQPKLSFLTRTHHLDNHFTVGPAILWSPFLLTTHAGVLIARALGSDVPADGFSRPYRVAMAFATALYAFLGLLLSFRLARQYVADVWVFLATIAIWWASSLPVYMYFNPSWSHAHSAFAVALFLWYWHETREQRSTRQWVVLGVIAGLMLNVYYPNLMVLLVLVVEGARQYVAASRDPARRAQLIPPLFAQHALFVAVVFSCLLPTFITRYIVYGRAFDSGYDPATIWSWRSPFFLSVLFSSEHGLFTWTPILFFAVIGLIWFRWREPRTGTPVLAAFVGFYVLIACYTYWSGIASFGSRLFVSLTSLFILGLSFCLERCAALFGTRRAAVATASAVLGCFVLWNAAFMFQWGTHLVPARGPISWPIMIHNQFFEVPRQLSARLQKYLFHRSELMREIEKRDIEQRKQTR